ncbi:unnamed protein product [Moneuplotes crassus]|uniref:Uncharacterized protein n=1 Tax=Euplotes crassus TaxID=5936 RepID=A0AAD1UGU4_EUPCR|nr:unnamed protein product [Moneuplotes crassus]
MSPFQIQAKSLQSIHEYYCTGHDPNIMNQDLYCVETPLTFKEQMESLKFNTQTQKKMKTLNKSGLTLSSLLQLKSPGVKSFSKKIQLRDKFFWRKLMRKTPNNRLRLRRNNTGFNRNLYQNVNKQGKLKSIIELNKMKYKRDNYKVDPKLLIKQSQLFQKK